VTQHVLAVGALVHPGTRLLWERLEHRTKLVVADRQDTDVDLGHDDRVSDSARVGCFHVPHAWTATHSAAAAGQEADERARGGAVNIAGAAIAGADLVTGLPTSSAAPAR
jgi:hypothetical protein